MMILIRNQSIIILIRNQRTTTGSEDQLTTPELIIMNIQTLTRVTQHMESSTNLEMLIIMKMDQRVFYCRGVLLNMVSKRSFTLETVQTNIMMIRTDQARSSL